MHRGVFRKVIWNKVFYPVKDEKDKCTVKRGLCAVVREAHVLGTVSPIAVC